MVAASGVIFAACYLLWMFQRVMFGENSNPKNHNLKDLSANEWITLVPIVIFIVWIGVYPKSFLKYSEQSTKALVGKVIQVQSLQTSDLIKGEE